MRKLGRRSVALFLVAVLQAACASVPAVTPPLAPREYRVQPGDTVRFVLVAAPDQPPAALDLVVQPDGFLMVPYLGAVQAGGRTPPELLAEVKRRLGRLFTTSIVPHLSLAVYPRRYVQVLGEVREPGSYPLTHAMRASDALALAGGLRRPRASADGAVLIRRGVEEHTFPIRFAEILEHGVQTTNYLLEPGDIVYVPPTGWRRVAYFIEDVLSPLHALISPLVAPASVVVAERSTRVVR